MSTKREQIIQLVKEYYRKEFESKKKDFEPGDKISYGGRFFNDEEMCALVDSSLDFWLTTGRYAARFEKEMAQFLNVRFCSLTNSGFPTTVTPVIQFGAVPVFVDVTIPGYNIDVTKLEDAFSDKTKAVMVAHTLGNPFDIAAVKQFCDKHGLWLIEDNCDALGSRYFIDGEWKYTGTIGDIGTSSFYPPHHMTMLYIRITCN